MKRTRPLEIVKQSWKEIHQSPLYTPAFKAALKEFEGKPPSRAKGKGNWTTSTIFNKGPKDFMSQPVRITISRNPDYAGDYQEYEEEGKGRAEISIFSIIRSRITDEWATREMNKYFPGLNQTADKHLAAVIAHEVKHSIDYPKMTWKQRLKDEDARDDYDLKYGLRAQLTGLVSGSYKDQLESVKTYFNIPAEKAANDYARKTLSSLTRLNVKTTTVKSRNNSAIVRKAWKKRKRAVR